MKHKLRQRKSSAVEVNTTEDNVSEDQNGVQTVETVDQIEDKPKNVTKNQMKEKTNENNIELNDKKCHQLDDNLMERIAENDKYFSAIIDLIPPKIYFEGNEEILESMETQKRQRVGEDLSLSLKAKQKRFKLDPNSDQKISEIAKQFYDNSNKKLNSKQNQSKDHKMDELRHRLEERITKLKSIRGQKRNAKQLRESKRERKKLNSLRASKQKGYKKRNLLDSNHTNDDNQESVDPKPKRVKFADSDGADDRKGKAGNDDKVPKIYNKEGNIVYSKFDLVSTNGTKHFKQKPKKKKLKDLLIKTKREEKKMSALEEKDVLKAHEVKEKKLWRNAIEKSEGIKVKNNSKLIAKTLKRKTKTKEKSRNQWSERTELVDKKLRLKDEKRKRNINKQKEMKKQNKIKKKGRK